MAADTDEDPPLPVSRSRLCRADRNGRTLQSGKHRYTVGPITIDAFYSTLLLFGALLVLAVADTYDPEAYGLESDDSEG